MKTKETIDQGLPYLGNLNTPKSRQKSLRPMRSMIAVRSLRPKTGVEQVCVKTQNAQKRD